jgi:hypothetical protein
MLGLMQSHFSAQIPLKSVQIAILEARDGLQVLQELNTPVARIILGLVLDVVASLTVPSTHADVFGDNINAVGDVEGGCQCWEKAINEILRVGIECLKATHDDRSIVYFLSVQAWNVFCLKREDSQKNSNNKIEGCEIWCKEKQSHTKNG